MTFPIKSCDECKQYLGIHRLFGSDQYFCTTCALKIGGTYHIKSPAGHHKNLEDEMKCVKCSTPIKSDDPYCYSEFEYATFGPFCILCRNSPLKNEYIKAKKK